MTRNNDDDFLLIQAVFVTNEEVQCEKFPNTFIPVIVMAEKNNTDWWITSALESNIGLNAIAQWTCQLGVSMPQGLGTGMIYSNNIHSPLLMEENRLWYRPEREWELQSIIDQ